MPGEGQAIEKSHDGFIHLRGVPIRQNHIIRIGQLVGCRDRDLTPPTEMPMAEQRRRLTYRDGHTQTDSPGDPRADPNNLTVANRHANAADCECGTHGYTYRRAAYSHSDTHLTASPADGYGHQS